MPDIDEVFTMAALSDYDLRVWKWDLLRTASKSDEEFDQKVAELIAINDELAKRNQSK